MGKRPHDSNVAVQVSAASFAPPSSTAATRIEAGNGLLLLRSVLQTETDKDNDVKYRLRRKGREGPKKGFKNEFRPTQKLSPSSSHHRRHPTHSPGHPSRLSSPSAFVVPPSLDVRTPIQQPPSAISLPRTEVPFFWNSPNVSKLSCGYTTFMPLAHPIYASDALIPSHVPSFPPHPSSPATLAASILLLSPRCVEPLPDVLDWTGNLQAKLPAQSLEEANHKTPPKPARSPEGAPTNPNDPAAPSCESAYRDSPSTLRAEITRTMQVIEGLQRRLAGSVYEELPKQPNATHALQLALAQTRQRQWVQAEAYAQLTNCARSHHSRTVCPCPPSLRPALQLACGQPL